MGTAQNLENSSINLPTICFISSSSFHSFMFEKDRFYSPLLALNFGCDFRNQVCCVTISNRKIASMGIVFLYSFIAYVFDFDVIFEFLVKLKRERIPYANGHYHLKRHLADFRTFYRDHLRP